MKKLVKDFSRSPKSIKVLILLLVLTTIGGGFLTGCQVGPSLEFVDSMKYLSENTLENYKNAVEKADNKQLEILLGKSPGAYKDVSPHTINRLKNQMVREVDAYILEIRENYKAARREDDGK